MKKKKIELKYRLEINWSPEDEAYIVKVPELPGCMTHADTPEKAVHMAQDAIAGYIESLEVRGLPVPQPLAEKRFTGKIPLRIDPNLHRDIAVKAEIEGVSVNRFIERKLKKAV